MIPLRIFRNSRMLPALLGALLTSSLGGQELRPAASLSTAPPAEVLSPARPDGERPETYGVDAATALALSAGAFSPNDSTTTYTYSLANGGQYITGGHPFLLHSVALPEGAQVTRVELDGCDNSNSGFLTLYFSKCAVGGPCADVTSVGTGSTDVPGCGRFSTQANLPITVDNFNNSYNVNVYTGGATPNAAFHAVRVYYKLQVSPAPLAPTFGDVPTNHLFFRHIEALAAAGITSGCGGGNFCPQQAVTRGEMAAFLAKALGLHWTP